MPRFRSTGSYEPDPDNIPFKGSQNRFDPQALTSLTVGIEFVHNPGNGFDPQALTSLTGWLYAAKHCCSRFRSTGSYEPDRLLDGLLRD